MGRTVGSDSFVSRFMESRHADGRRMGGHVYDVHVTFETHGVRLRRKQRRADTGGKNEVKKKCRFSVDGRIGYWFSRHSMRISYVLGELSH